MGVARPGVASLLTARMYSRCVSGTNLRMLTSSSMRWRSGLMGFSLIGGSCLEVGVLDPSILKTERPPVTRARSNGCRGRRNAPDRAASPLPRERVRSLTRKRPCGVTACPLILPRSRSPVRRVSAPRSRGTAQCQLTYGMLVDHAASALFAPMIAAATAWFENNRCLAVSLGATTAFCCQDVHQCRGSADGPHRKYLPVSDRCRLVRPQVRADVQ
jgi:hypothetical protein